MSRNETGQRWAAPGGRLVSPVDSGLETAGDRLRRPAGAMAVRDLRIDGMGWLAIVAAGLGGALLLYLDRGLTFVGDDWTFVVETISPPPWGPLAPHNEQWVTLHRLLYELLFQTVGLRSYLPFLVPLVLAHLGAVLTLFALVRRQAGDLVAPGAAVILLLFGAGAESLTWAFRIETVVPVLCGLLALLLLERPRLPRPAGAAAAALLLGGVMFSGTGIVYAGVVAVELALREPRRRLVVVAPAVIACLAWFLVIGRGAIDPPVSLDTVAALKWYVPVGVAVSVAALFGLSARWGFAALTVVSPALVLGWNAVGRPRPRAVAALAGVVLLFLLAGLSHDSSGTGQAGSSSLYAAAPLLLLLAAELVGGLRPGLTWTAALAAVVVVSVALNLVHLRHFLADRTAMAAQEDVQLGVVGAFRGAPDLDGDVTIMPPFATPVTPRQYYAAVDRYGSPVRPVGAAQVASLPAGATDDTLRELFGPALRSAAAPAPPSLAGCLSAGPGQRATVETSSAGRVLVVPARPGRIDVFLWSVSGPPPAATAAFPASGPVLITFPDTGSALPWKAAIVTVAGAHVCPVGG